MYKIPLLDLTKENVFERVSSYQIFKFYSRNFRKINENFISDLRTDDKDPSARISKIDGDLLYTDFGKGSYRAIDYVMEKFGLSFYDALRKINRDFALELGFDDNFNVTRPAIQDRDIKNIPNRQPTIIRIKKINWTKKNFAYWEQYGWTPDMLEKARIFPISHFWLHNDRVDKGFIADKLSYTIEYYWHGDIFRRKLMFPKRSKEKRFLTNADRTVVQGYHLLPKEGGKLLIITKSIKDCGIFWRLGIHAISPNNETAFLPDGYVEKLKKRWSRVVLWFDNDLTGIAKGKEFGEQFKLQAVCNPIDCEFKDPSDYVKEKGFEEFEALVNQTLYTCIDTSQPFAKSVIAS